MSRSCPVTFVSYDAERQGAPVALLRFLRWLRAETDLDFEVLVLHDGPLVADFAAVGDVWTPLRRRWVSVAPLVYLNGALAVEHFGSVARSAVPAVGARRVVAHLHEAEVGLWASLSAAGGRVLRRADRVVAVSEAAGAAAASSWGVPSRRIVVHEPALLPESVRAAAEARAAARAALDIPLDALVVGAVGPATGRKAPDLFLRMMSELGPEVAGRPVRGVWLGATFADIHDWPLRFDLAELAIEDRVRTVASTAEPFATLGAFDVLAITSREDPFPLVAMEAALLGVPAVTVDGGGAADLVHRASTEGPAGFAVPLGSVGDMAARVRDLAGDPELRCKAATRAAGEVRRHHDLAVAGPALLATIEAAMPPGPHRPRWVPRQPAVVAGSLAASASDRAGRINPEPAPVPGAGGSVRRAAARGKARHGAGSISTLVRRADWWGAMVGPLLAVALLQVLRHDLTPRIALVRLAALVWSAAALAAYGYVVNDWSDIASDRRAGKRNAMAGVPAPARLVLVVALVALGAAPWLVLGHDVRLHAAAIGVLAAIGLMPLLYSARPVRLKERGVGGLVADAANAHVLPTLFAVTLLLGPSGGLHGGDLALLVLAGVWASGFGLRSIVVHQLVDADRDCSSGVRTWVVAHGEARGRRLIVRALFPVEVAALAGLAVIVALTSYGLLVAFACYAALYELTWAKRHPPPWVACAKADDDDYVVLGEWYTMWPALAFALALTLRDAWYWIAVAAVLGAFPSSVAKQTVDLVKMLDEVRSRRVAPAAHRLRVAYEAILQRYASRARLAIRLPISDAANIEDHPQATP